MQSLRQAISSPSQWSIFLVVLEKLTPTPIIFYFGGVGCRAVVLPMLAGTPTAARQ
jgi:hypothetical protein